MGLEQAIDITATQRKTVLTLLQHHLPRTEAWVYGSRTKWTARPQSDLDLVVFATPEQRNRIGALREAFEESDLPFRVDLFMWDEVPEEFREEIETEHVVLVAPTPMGRNPDGAGQRQPVPFAQLLVEPVRNGIYKKKEFHGRGIKVVNMGELFAFPRLRGVPMKRVELSSTEQSKFLIQPGDLLFARRSLVAEGAGKCSIVLDAPEPTTFESSIIRARPNPTQADSLFLYYYFNSHLGLHALDSIRRQVAVAGITGSDLARLDIQLPALLEQRTIARILGTVDDKIELNRRMNKTLEAMACAVFKSWFVDFDPVRAKMERHPAYLAPEVWDLFPSSLDSTGLPASWRIGTIGECFHLTMGQSPPGSTYNDRGEGLPFFQGRSDFGFRYPTNRKHCSAPSRIAESDDTLVSVRAPVGDINLAWEKCCFGRGVAVLRHKSGSRSFTHYATRAIQNELKHYEQTGTVFGAINRKPI